MPTLPRFFVRYLLVLGFSLRLTLSLNAQTHLQQQAAGLIVPAGNKMILPGDLILASEAQTESFVRLDGSLALGGDWTLQTDRQSPYPWFRGAGLLQLNGSQAQAIRTQFSLRFYQLQVDNPAGLYLDQDHTISTSLEISSGKIYTQGNLLTVWNPALDAIKGYDSTRYIVGRLRRYINSDQTYDLPVGSEDYLQLLRITHESGEVPDYLEVNFVSTPLASPVGVIVDGSPVQQWLDNGYWQLDSEGGKNYRFKIEATSRGHRNGAADPAQHVMMSRPDSQWLALGNHLSFYSQGQGVEPIRVARSGIEQLGDLAIGTLAFALSTPQDKPFSGIKLLNNGDPTTSAMIQFEASSSMPYRIEGYSLNGQLLFLRQGMSLVGSNELPIPHRGSSSIRLIRFSSDWGTQSFTVY